MSEKTSRKRLLEFAAPPIGVVHMGIVGLGHRGLKAVERYALVDGAEIVAVADHKATSTAEANRMLVESGRPKAREFHGSSGASEMMALDSVDMVYICTDWHSHAALAVEAMQRGKHVAVEVPAAMTVAECELLINNAGIADIGLFTDLTDERLAELMNTNLFGHMRLTKDVLPQMLRRHSGSVINISSVWGESGASCEVAYSAAKAGLIGFTKALAKECAPSGVRVNCVSCGLIDTKMNITLSEEDLNAVTDEIPMGRMGTPDDIANAVMFLAEESSAYITGQVLRVDGGWL